MDICAFGKGKGTQSKVKHDKGKGKGTQGQHGQDKDKRKDSNKDSIGCWNCGKRTLLERLLEQKKNTNNGGLKGKHKPKNNMCYFDAHDVEVHCCLLESTRLWMKSLSCMVTQVTCATRVRMLRRKSMLGTRRR